LTDRENRPVGTAGERWLRAACRLYPAEFRALLEEDLVDRFRKERASVSKARGDAAARWWSVRTVTQVAWGAAPEWLASLRAQRASDDAYRTDTRRSERRNQMFETSLQDLKVAVRSLVRRSPGFTALAVLTLALGVAADTTVFSVVDGVLLRPLPHPDSHELVTVSEVSAGGAEEAVAGPNFVDWKAANHTFEHMVARSNPAYRPASTVLGGDEPVRATWSSVSHGFFEMMGVTPAAGRGFVDEDFGAGAELVAVVSHAFWERYLGRTNDLTARTLQGEGSTFTVVGVMPPGFDFPDRTDLWLPLQVEPDGSRTAHNWLVVGRLRDGVTLEAAQTDLDRITARVRTEVGDEMDAVGTRVRSLQEDMYGSMRGPLRLLLGASALVLLVGCINLASALLARGRRREGEVAVRAALGAGRSRIVRQLVTENAVLALLGTAAGVALAIPALELVLRVGPAALQERVGLDVRVLAITSAISAGVILLFGLLPALAGARSDLATALRAAGRGADKRTRFHWDLLIVGEVALTLVLLAGTGVLSRSFARVLAVDPGFEPRDVWTAELPFPSGAYVDDASIAASHSAILEAVRSVPGVRDAGLVNHLPLGGLAYNGDFEREDGLPVESSVDYRIASTEYFGAMGIPLVEGRLFEVGDDARVEDVAVVSRSLAERHWPGQSPVGRRIRNLANDSWIYPDRWITIVGVVGDVRHRALTQDARPTVYVHNLQRPARASSPVLVVRMERGATTPVSELRARIQAVEPRVPVTFSAMEARLAASLVDRRFTMLVMGAFALATLTLAAVGIYGVVSYAVAQRTREMGIRIALGASTGRVLRGVVSSSLRNVLLGAVVGSVGALAGGRLLAGMLYEVAPADPVSLLGAAAVLIAVAAAASLIPARRATRIDPVSTMKAD
jgi:predicted permease